MGILLTINAQTFDFVLGLKMLPTAVNNKTINPALRVFVGTKGIGFGERRSWQKASFTI